MSDEPVWTYDMHGNVELQLHGVVYQYFMPSTAEQNIFEALVEQGWGPEESQKMIAELKSSK